jgi:hypothetical protein
MTTGHYGLGLFSPLVEMDDEFQKPKFQLQVLIECIIETIGGNSWGVFQR